MMTSWKFLVSVVLIIFSISSIIIALPVDFFQMFNNCTRQFEFLGITYEDLSLSENSLAPQPSFLYLYYYRIGYIPVRFPLSASVKYLLHWPGFDRNLPLVIYIPGFLESPVFPSVVAITSNLLLRGGANVLHLDGSVYLGNPHYLYVASINRLVGEHLGVVLANIVKEGISAKNIHIIGFSFGAHVAGFAAKKFSEITGQKLSRISGLDPAGMCFYDNPPSLRLDYSDADFVDIIHSNAGNWGLNKSIGHVDFYPNSGYDQPYIILPALSHQYSWLYYAESILYPKNFEAVRCGSWDLLKNGKCYNNPKTYMGFNTPSFTKGIYYLKTNIIPPFGYGRIPFHKKV